jgi:thioredoxin-related protein
MKKQKLNSLNTYLIIALVIVVAIGLYFTLSVPVAKKEEAKPVPVRELQLAILGTDCEDCFDIKAATDFIKQQANVNVTEIKESTMEESAEMIAKYGVTRLPALLIMGDIENLTIPNFNQKEDALVFDQVPPPYYDVEAKRIKGKVSIVTLADPACTQCFDISLIVEQLKQAGIKIVTEQTIDSTSVEGQGLIQKYSIEKIPTIIFNQDALEYEVVKQVWDQVGTEESDGKLVLRFVNPPYINASTGKTEGLVTMSLIYDATCTECFNVSVYKEVFTQSFNMHVEKEEMLDLASTKGKFLIKKYNLTAVPTVVLSKEAGAYPNLAQAWEQVGTSEKDGSFAFRNLALLKAYFEQQGQPFAYKDLATGEVSTGTEATVEEPEITQPENETES